MCRAYASMEGRAPARSRRYLTRDGRPAMVDFGVQSVLHTLRAGTNEPALVRVFGERAFEAIHRARSCALDRYTQVCFRKRE